MNKALLAKLDKARAVSLPAVTDRARRGLQAFVATSGAEAVARMADGSAAQGIGRIGLSALNPTGLACSEGCAFCCILTGDDGGLITEAEATALFHVLAPLAGQPDGRDWHPKACPSLDPETQKCRGYDARPVICRAYVSTDSAACEKVSQGETASGPGTLDPYHAYLAALGLSRAALKGTKRVSTHALSRLAAAAVDGLSLDNALARSRHAPSELDAELRRSKRDLTRAR